MDHRLLGDARLLGLVGLVSQGVIFSVFPLPRVQTGRSGPQTEPRIGAGLCLPEKETRTQSASRPQTGTQNSTHKDPEAGPGQYRVVSLSCDTGDLRVSREEADF